MRIRSVISTSLIALLCVSAAPLTGQNGAKDGQWRNYGADLGNTHYSPLDQINASNFNKLQVAWRFKTDNLGPRPEFQYEGTPLVIKGRMYVTGGSRRAVVCLDPATGELKWVYSLEEGERGRNAPRQYSGHGVSFWSDDKGDDRILYVTPGYRLIALNAATGQPIPGFGENGIVD